jgi:5-formyltetrahydrofolate cyclo-ligase
MSTRDNIRTGLSEMRKVARSHRQTKNAVDRGDADRKIAGRAIKMAEGCQAKIVASYLADDGEPSMDLVHEWANSVDVVVVEPTLDTHGLRFAVHDGLAATVLNRYGMPEPADPIWVPIDQIDVIFVPLVLFDAQCNRAGRGGGWYDKTLAQRSDSTVLAGIAYEGQKVDVVPTHAADIQLDQIITEERTYGGDKSH